MNNASTGWQLKTVNELCELRRGASPRPISDAKYFGDRSGWVRISDVTKSTRFLYKTEQYLSELGESKSVRVFPGEVIMSICATIGKPIIVQMNACIHDGFVVFKYLIDEVDNIFFLYWLQSKESYFESLGQHGTQKNLNTGLVKDTEISLPPILEQRKIASILSSVDDAIEKTEEIITQTEKIKQGLIQQLLTKGIDHTDYKMTEIGEIPIDWEVVRLEDIASVERGKFSHRPRNDPKFYGGAIPFVQTGDVTKAVGYLDTHSQTLNELGLSVSKLFPKGTILVTIAANIGETAIATYDVCFPDSLVGVIPNDRVHGEYLELALRMKKDSLDKAATQSAQKNINLQNLRPLLIPLPPQAEQRQISEIIGSLESKVKLEFSYQSGLKIIKQSLMNVLLSGQVRVKVDEPLEVSI